MTNIELIIIDDDFEEVVETRDWFVVEDLGTAVCSLYEKRNLPVAKNLFLAFRYAIENFGVSMASLIDWNCKPHNIYYSKYEQDFKMYLLFS